MPSISILKSLSPVAHQRVYRPRQRSFACLRRGSSGPAAVHRCNCDGSSPRQQVGIFSAPCCQNRSTVDAPFFVGFTVPQSIPRACATRPSPLTPVDAPKFIRPDAPSPPHPRARLIASKSVTVRGVGSSSPTSRRHGQYCTCLGRIIHGVAVQRHIHCWGTTRECCAVPHYCSRITSFSSRGNFQNRRPRRQGK